MTGAAGGVIRDVLLNNVPVIFKKRNICHWQSIVWWLGILDLNNSPYQCCLGINTTFFVVCAIRWLAIRYHISLPILRNEENESEMKEEEN